MEQVSFTISSIQKATRKQPLNQYTGQQSGDKLWRVSLRSSWQPDHFIDAWFIDEAQARKTPKGNITVQQLFDLLAPLDAKYTVGSITQSRLMLDINDYTGRPDWMDAWKVGFDVMYGASAPGASFLDFIYPTSYEAEQWSLGRAYGVWEFLEAFAPYYTPPLYTFPLPPPPVITPPPPPAPVLTAIGQTNQNVLYWTPLNLALSYTIWSGAASGAESPNPIAVGVSGNTFVDTNVVNGTTYYYYIAAIGDSGQSPNSNEASATPQFPIPQPPTWGPVSTGSGVVSLSWNPDPLGGVQTFNLYRGTTSGGETSIATDLTSPSYADSGLTNEATYYYLVNATNEVGTSAYSAEISVTLGPPVAPSALAATPGNGSVSLTWTGDPNANVQTFSVYRGPSGSETLIAKNLSSASYTDNAVTNHSLYFYYVTASSAGGTSGPSAEVSAVPGPPYPPSDVTISVASGAVGLLWDVDPLGGSQTFSVYRGTSPGSEVLLASGGTLAGYSDTSVSNGTTYFYYVTSTNSVGASDPSSEVFGTPEPNVPPAPVGLAAQAGNSSVALSWTAAPTATSYDVSRGTVSGGETLLASGVSTDTYTDSTVTNGDTYFYIVQGVNGGGTGPESAEVSVIPGPPVAPTGVFIFEYPWSITVGWDATLNTTGYELYRGTSSGGESSTAIAVLTQTATPEYPLEYVDSGVSPGTTYYYVVKAANVVGRSPASEEVSANPIGVVVYAPTGVTAIAGNNKIVLDWVEAVGAENYTIARSETPSEEVPLVGGVTGDTYTDTSVTNGLIYYYTIASFNGIGLGPYSAEVSAIPGPPHAPTSLAGTPSETTIALTWDETDSGVTYKVYRGASSATATTLIASGVASTAYTNTGLANHTKYFYTVRAVNSVGLSPASNVASATTTGPPLAPTKLTGTAKSPYSSIKLTWGAGAGATTYNVYRATAPFTTLPTALATGVSGLTYTDSSSLTQGVTYYYRVAGVNGIGTGAASNQEAVVNGPCAAPTLSLSQPNSPYGNFSLSWTVSTGSTSYIIGRSAVTGSAAVSVNVGATRSLGMLNLLDKGILPPLISAGKTLTFHVIAVNADGNSVNSNSVNVVWYPYVGTAQQVLGSAPTSYTYSTIIIDVYSGSGLERSGHPTVYANNYNVSVGGYNILGFGWVRVIDGLSRVSLVWADFADLTAPSGGFLLSLTSGPTGTYVIRNYPAGNNSTYDL